VGYFGAPDMVPSITFIFMPLLMMTSPPFMPGLQGPIHVIVISVSGLVWPSNVIVIVILELKSPVMTACVVLTLPGVNSQVDVLVQLPSILCAIELDLQFFCRIPALKADIFASVAASMQDWVVKGFPSIIIELSQSPDLWCGTAISAAAMPDVTTATQASMTEFEILMGRSS
jgi:hypothetical protein